MRKFLTLIALFATSTGTMAFAHTHNINGMLLCSAFDENGLTSKYSIGLGKSENGIKRMGVLFKDFSDGTVATKLASSACEKQGSMLVCSVGAVTVTINPNTTVARDGGLAAEFSYSLPIISFNKTGSCLPDNEIDYYIQRWLEKNRM